MDERLFFVVCMRCAGTGTEHESSHPCTRCRGTRVLKASQQSRVVALEFLRVAQPLLGLSEYEESAALRRAVEGVARWLATHPGDVALEPPELPPILNPRNAK